MKSPEEFWRTMAVFYVLHTPSGNVNFINVHLNTPRKGLEALMQGRRSQIQPVIDNIAQRRHESQLVKAKIKLLEGPVIIAGDFNMTADSAIFREFWSEYEDSFELAGFGFGYTKFLRKWGVRIDHLLVDRHWHSRKCVVAGDVGSDHRPLISELVASP